MNYVFSEHLPNNCLTQFVSENESIWSLVYNLSNKFRNGFLLVTQLIQQKSSEFQDSKTGSKRFGKDLDPDCVVSVFILSEDFSIELGNSS